MSVDAPLRNNVLRRLPVEQTINPNHGGRHRLSLVYRTRDLIVLGLGVMIGAGIFQIAGQEAATTAGPAVIISFIIAGVACLLSALSYAELSSTMPVAGSAYSFTYVAFGEVWAWIIGWALVLELQLAVAVVGRAWSLSATGLINDTGSLSGAHWVKVPSALSGVVGQTKGFDLFALLIIVILAVVVAIGARLSLYTLWFMVLAKVIVITFVIVGGLMYFSPDNLKPFVPPAQHAASAAGGRTLFDLLIGGSPHAFGIFGIFAATSAIAFAYIGFDLIATSAEETEDAPRKIPRGMIVSLLIAITLYIGVAIAMVGMVPYKSLNPATPLSSAFKSVGSTSMSVLIDVGGVIGLSTVILVVMIAQTRVLFAMARDGLLPSPLAAISPKYRVPTRAAVLVGVSGIALSQIDVITFNKLTILTLDQMIVIGTLFTFVFVSAGVMALRRSRPDLPRAFRVPGVPVTPVLAILATGWLMLNLHERTWEYFAIWMAAGLAVYMLYGRRHSRLRLILGGRPMRGGGQARHAARHRR